MFVGSTRNHWHDPNHTEFGTFLNRPFHPIKLDDGNGHCEPKRFAGSYLLAKLKLNAIVIDRGEAPRTNTVRGCDLKFLPHARAENAGEMLSMGTN
jgi:hypothetical protein